jgi:hypothetical protein
MGALTGRAVFPSHGLRSRNRLLATASSVTLGVSHCAKRNIRKLRRVATDRRRRVCTRPKDRASACESLPLWTAGRAARRGNDASVAAPRFDQVIV